MPGAPPGKRTIPLTHTAGSPFPSVTLAVILVLLTAVGAQAVAIEAVLVGSEYQYRGDSNETYFSWTQKTDRRPGHYDAYAKGISGGSRIRLNTGRTEGVSDGFDPGTNSARPPHWPTSCEWCGARARMT